MDALEELFGLDPDSPETLRADFLVESDMRLLDQLIELRRSRNLSQREVGELMGVSQPSVAHFEAHDSNPRLSTIRRYAMAVGALIRHQVELDEGQLADGRWERLDVIPERGRVHFSFQPLTILIESEALAGSTAAGAAPFRGLEGLDGGTDQGAFALAA